MGNGEYHKDNGSAAAAASASASGMWQRKTSLWVIGVLCAFAGFSVSLMQYTSFSVESSLTQMDQWAAEAAAAAKRVSQAASTLTATTPPATSAIVKDVTHQQAERHVNHRKDDGGKKKKTDAAENDTDNGKADNGKADDEKADDGEADDGKVDDSKTDDDKADDGKADDDKADDDKADDDKTNDDKDDDGKEENGKTNDGKSSDAKSDDGKDVKGKDVREKDGGEDDEDKGTGDKGKGNKGKDKKGTDKDAKKTDEKNDKDREKEESVDKEKKGDSKKDKGDKGSEEEEQIEKSTEKCGSWKNSEDWLKGPRYGNVHDGMTEDLVRHLIFDSQSPPESQGSAVPLQQSLCEDDSRFRTWEWPSSWRDDDDDETVVDKEMDDFLLRDMAARLVFLAFHEHQHAPAREEATQRLSCQDKSAETRHLSNDKDSKKLQEEQLGLFDYECPNAKFLVAKFPTFGLGSSLRNCAVNALLLGLRSNRVVLIRNEGPAGKKIATGEEFFSTEPWPLASCPRHDLQCVFLPLSPCVLSEQELRDAPVVQQGEVDQPEYQDERVLLVEVKFDRPQTAMARQEVAATIETMYQHRRRQMKNTPLFDNNDPWNLEATHLEKILNYIRTEQKQRWLLSQTAALYFLRPNVVYAQKLNQLVHKVFPQDFDSSQSLGLAIRSSDKCTIESECLTFDQYMDLIQVFAQKLAKKETGQNNDNNEKYSHNTLVLTSESLDVLQSRLEYETKPSFPFAFVVNGDDPAQGTGNPSRYTEMGLLNVTADDIMLSTLVVLKMQQQVQGIVVNCCSHFHKLIIELRESGCGSVRKPITECLQQNENAQYRLCCYFSNTPECRDKMKLKKVRKIQSADVLHPALRNATQRQR